MVQTAWHRSSSASESPRRSSPNTTATSPPALRRRTSAASARGSRRGRPSIARDDVPHAQIVGPSAARRSGRSAAASSTSVARRAVRRARARTSSRAVAAPPLRGAPDQASGSTTTSRESPKFFMARAAAPRFSALCGRWRTTRTFPGSMSDAARITSPPMIPDAQLHAQLPHTLRQIDLPALGELYRGKVRDNYSRGDRIVMITTDRVSAFDHVLGTIPFKGEVLSRLTAFWFEKVKDIAPTHLIDSPDPSVMVVKRAKALPIELVIRGYITGSLWRDYRDGKAGAYGIDWPKGLKKDQAFDQAIITPSTKEEYGKHDEPISEAAILDRKIVAPEIWKEACAIAHRLFQRGQEWARSRGLILVDTKYEMGVADGKLVVIDEIHTPDSSRYWVAQGYAERFASGAEQEMLDKENIRQWLIKEHGFSGHGKPPPLSDDVRVMLARKYIAAFERLTGQTFASEVGSVEERIKRNLQAKGYA